MRYLFVVLIACAWFLAPAVWAAAPCCAASTEEEEAERKPIELFNGTDFEGWKLFIPDENVDPATVWSVREGMVHCVGTPIGYMRTVQKFSDYKLAFEWRWPGEGGNSGALLHISGEDKVWPKSIESQLHSANAGDFWVIDGTSFKEHRSNEPGDRRVRKMEESNEKPLGEWNKMEIICAGNTIKVYVNGLLQNVATETTVKEGYIGLQSEGTPVEFRNIKLWPLSEENEED